MLDALLAERGILGEMCLLGGTVMMLAMEIVAKFYPSAQVPARTQFVIEDVFASLKGRP